jgi:hypothetical protein
MAKLEIPTSQLVPGSDDSGGLGSRLRESSAEAAARMGASLKAGGVEAAQVSAGLGQSMAQAGQKFFDEAKQSVDDATYNNAYSNASTEFNQAVQQRLNTPTDEKGSPNFQNLPQDIAVIGDKIASKYSANLIDGKTRNRFNSNFNNLATNHQILAMGQARKQQVDYSISSLQNNLTSTLNNALSDDPSQLGLHYAQGVEALNKARDSGYISAQDAQEGAEKLRHNIYTGAAGIMNSKDPVSAEKWLSDPKLLNLTPLERNELQKQNQSALNAQDRQQKAQEAEQQKLLKQQQTSNAWDLQRGMAEGKIKQPDLDQAFQSGKISHDTYQQLSIKNDADLGITAKRTATNTRIGNDIGSGRVLEGYSAKEISDYYNDSTGLLSKDGKPADITAKAGVAVGIKAQVKDFTNEVKGTLQSGKPEDVIKAVNAFTDVQSKNPLAASGIDKKSLAMISSIETDLKYQPGVDPQEIVNKARAATTLTPELIKFRQEMFDKNDNLKLVEDKTGKIGGIEKTIKDAYGLESHLISSNDEIAPEVIPTIRNLMKEGMIQTGDLEKSIAYVKKATKGAIDVSTFNGNRTLMAFPPESTIKDSDGRTFDAPTLRKNFESETAELASKSGLSVGDLQIHSDEVTKQNLAHPSYSVSDANGNPLINPETHQPVRWQPDGDSVRHQSINDAHAQGVDAQQSQQNISGEEDAIQNNKAFTTIPLSKQAVPSTISNTVQSMKSAVAGIESAGETAPYKAVGPVVHGDDQALGKYQILQSNLASWSKEALGRVVSRDEFLNSPQIQEKIFENKMGEYLKTYGSVADALSMWHSGRPLAQARAANATDVATGLKTTDYVNKALSNMNRGIPEDARMQTADANVMHTPMSINNMTSKISSVPDTAIQYAPTIGDLLAKNTEANVGVRYDFGSKSTASGGIDCSGWVAENTLKCMQQINASKGNVYDLNTMKAMLNQGAAYQIASIARSTGYVDESDVRSGNVVPGTLIGIRAANVPGWAADRPNGISHIVQVVVKDGQKYVSQSAGSSGGVNLMPYEQWAKLEFVKNAKLYAVNPFNMVASAGKGA